VNASYLGFINLIDSCLYSVKYIHHSIMLALLIVGYLSTIYASSTLENCNTRSKINIHNLTLTHPSKQAVQFDVVYEVYKRIERGRITYSCSLNGFHVFYQESDLCTQVQCPIHPGIYTLTNQTDVPNVSGFIKCTMEWIDTDPLLCIELKVGEPLINFWKWL